MSIHRSLVPKNTLKRARNVLTRAERIEMLLKDGRWKEGESVFGLPKVATLKAKKRIKKVKTPEEGEAEAENETPTEQ
jgi:small basic protein (TIGR04137 family)